MLSLSLMKGAERACVIILHSVQFFLFEAQGGIEKSMFTACPCNFIFFASKQGQMAQIEKLHFFPLLTFLKENSCAFVKRRKAFCVACCVLPVGISFVSSDSSSGH